MHRRASNPDVRKSSCPRSARSTRPVYSATPHAGGNLLWLAGGRWWTLESWGALRTPAFQDRHWSRGNRRNALVCGGGLSGSRDTPPPSGIIARHLGAASAMRARCPSSPDQRRPRGRSWAGTGSYHAHRNTIRHAPPSYTTREGRGARPWPPATPKRPGPCATRVRRNRLTIPIYAYPAFASRVSAPTLTNAHRAARQEGGPAGGRLGLVSGALAGWLRPGRAV